MFRPVLACAALLAAAGCGPHATQAARHEDPDDKPPTTETNHTTASGAASSESSTSDEPPNPPGRLDPPECKYYETRCGNECAQIGGNDEHCTECFDACPTIGLGSRCEDFACQPLATSCVQETDGFRNCRDVCEDLGLTCPGRCTRNYNGEFRSTPGCGGGLGIMNYDPCDTPIDWTQTGANYPLAGVRCCCDFVGG